LQNTPVAPQIFQSSVANNSPINSKLQSSVAELSRIRNLLWQQRASDQFAAVFTSADFGRMSRADAAISIYFAAERLQVEHDEHATERAPLKTFDVVEAELRRLGRRRCPVNTFENLTTTISSAEGI
jgi:hypothetical protein